MLSLVCVFRDFKLLPEQRYILTRRYVISMGMKLMKRSYKMQIVAFFVFRHFRYCALEAWRMLYFPASLIYRPKQTESAVFELGLCISRIFSFRSFRDHVWRPVVKRLPVHRYSVHVSLLLQFLVFWDYWVLTFFWKMKIAQLGAIMYKWADTVSDCFQNGFGLFSKQSKKKQKTA